MTIRTAEPRDLGALERLRALLRPGIDPVENATEAAALLTDASWAMIVAEEAGEVVGFVEARLREYAENCETSPVGFVEGWYVEAPYRRVGIGRRLVAAAEDWARAQGCSEMASDANIDNHLSHRAHQGLGYEEVERLVCFRKPLAQRYVRPPRARDS